MSLTNLKTQRAWLYGNTLLERAPNQTGARMNRHRRWNALVIRIGLLVAFVATISLAGGVVTAFAADLADAAGVTPAVHSLLVNASAALIALAGVAFHAKSVRTWRP